MPLAENLRKDLTLAAVCIGIGVLLDAIGWAQSLWLSVLVSLGMGFTTRYGKILLNRWRPCMPLSMQYLMAALLAVSLWGLLPIILRFSRMSEVSFVGLDDYVSALVLISVVTLAVCYLYYSREQALLLQQALDRAELARIHKEKQVLKARLRLLQSQIEPHFLFNTLSTVHALIAIEPQQAGRMLAALTALLRQSLDRTRREWLTLGDELMFNRSYLAIQQIRLGERLRVHFDLADDVRDDIPFPPLLLHPLIENAVVHGIEPLREGGDLHVGIAVKDERLVIRLHNDSPSDPGRDEHQGHRIGLHNTCERLRQLYGDAASFSYREQSPQGVLVTMEIPLNVDDPARPDRG